MTEQERLRAIFGNLKNYSFDVNPTYKINEQDAFVLREMYADYLALKDRVEKEQKRRHEYYERHKEEYHETYLRTKEKRLARAREKYREEKARLFDDHK